MQKETFNIDKFNILQDEEFFYFIRALNKGDNSDLENNITTDANGNIVNIRTDRQRWEEVSEEMARYDENSELSLIQVFDHIKMHNRKDTNCISLSSNANVSLLYGRKNYKDRYVLVKVPKREFGNKVFNAGEYMLLEIDRLIDSCIGKLDYTDERVAKVLSKIKEIDSATNNEEIMQIISIRYNTRDELPLDTSALKRGVTYAIPTARLGNWQVLDENQTLEKNRIIAKLTLLERSDLMLPVITNSSNNKLLIQTVGNAFSSLEQIHYGEISKDKIIDVPKEIIDILALLQQIPREVEGIEELKQEVIKFANNNEKINIPEESVLFRKDCLKDDISIEELYELTHGKVRYGDASSIVKKMFYLAKSQLYARELASYIRTIVKDNPIYEKAIEYIENNCFEIEPEIVTRLSNKGHKISESVNLDLRKNEENIVDEIKRLTNEELINILESGGFSNIRNIMTNAFSQSEVQNELSIEDYYAEAILSSINWKKVGIEDFSEVQKNEFIKRLANENPRQLYLELQSAGVDRKDIPNYILNIVISSELKTTVNADNYMEYINQFLEYYKVNGTELVLRDYQQEAVENVDRILENKKFASVTLPTGAGKSFVALAEMLKYKDKPILYLAPQNEIIEQMKDNILHYVLGKRASFNRDKDIAEAFPNLKFEIYPGLNSKRGKKLVKEKYDFIVLDELHRTGAKEWEKSINNLLTNQNENVKVLGISATPTRDVDDRDMADETAKKLGYTKEETEKGEHIAKELDLQAAIQLGLVVNPRIVSFIYKLNENLRQLSDRINRLEEGFARDALQQEYNIIEKRYEETRKYVSEAEGISDILKSNLKQGGRYIVFVPVGENEEYEDEDGNKVGKKTGKSKIEEYKKKIANEYLRSTGITPKFYSMLGEYSDKKNNDELKGFESDDSEAVKFLVVMNKANEGLHIDKLNGMLWFRDIDEDSLILMLQQLGRVIYSEDPNNPTTDEDRPIVIDACNNVLKLLKESKKKNIRRSDLSLLEEIINWSEKHNKIPDVHSSNNREQRYAVTLYRIQNKYRKYLDNPEILKDLEEKDVNEVRKVLDKGSEIDLWEIYLTPTEKEEIAPKIGVDLFEVESLVTDLIKIQEKIEVEEDKTVVARTLDIAKVLKANGVDLSKIQLSKIINKKHIYTLLKEIEQDGIDINEIIKENGLDENFNWGRSVCVLRNAYNGGNNPITEVEKREAEELGLIPQKEKSVIAKTIDVARILKANDIEVAKIPLTKTVNGKTRFVLLKEIEQEGIDIDRIIRENGLDENFNWGRSVYTLRKAYNRFAKNITEVEKKEAEELGLIPQKEKSVIAKTLEVARILKANGVDLNKIQLSKKVNGKQINILLKDIRQDGIDINRIIRENGLDGNFELGRRVNHLRAAYSGIKKAMITEDDRKEAEKLELVSEREEDVIAQTSEVEGALKVKAKSVIAQTLEVARILKANGINLSKIQLTQTIKGETRYILLEDIKQEGIDVEKIIKENALDGKFNFGRRMLTLKNAYNGLGTSPITEEEKEEAEELGLIPKKAKSVIAQTLEVARILKANGVDLSKIQLSKKVNGKHKYTLLKEVTQNGIDIAAIIRENKLDGNFDLGNRISILRTTYKGIGNYKITETEKKEAEELGLIPKKEKSVIAQTLEVARILKANGVDLSRIQLSKYVNRKQINILLKEVKQDGIDIETIIRENGLDGEFNLGNRINNLRSAYKETEDYKITEAEKKEAEELGLISEKMIKLVRAKKLKDVAKELNEETRKKEEELEIGKKSHES